MSVTGTWRFAIVANLEQIVRVVTHLDEDLKNKTTLSILGRKDVTVSSASAKGLGSWAWCI